MQNIINAIKSLNLEIAEEQAKKLYHFYELVVEENDKVNLTAITDYSEFVIKHYVDSLSLYLLKDASFEAVDLLERPDSKVFDLGTGGGFPGIPLAIVFPKAEYILLDSLQKRIHFLQAAVAKLSLANVEAIHGRAEDFARQSDYREQFDLCVSRAVANLSTLTEYALPFVKVGGYFISYKGAEAEDEIMKAKYAIKALGGQIDHIEAFDLPTTEFHRTLVIIKKIKSTENKYPRKAGIPSKKPLAK